MVTISYKDWTDFVAEVRSRLDVIDANIISIRAANEVQHEALKADFDELKDFIMGKDPSSIANRVRSLEDSRTRMNGAQLGISAAFSVVTAAVSWLLGHPNIKLTFNGVTNKLYAIVDSLISFVSRRS